jgi:hypothetical protein
MRALCTQLIVDAWLVAKKYLRFWFWLDLLSTVPFDWFLEGAFDFSSQDCPQAALGAAINATGSDIEGEGATQAFSFLKIFKVVKLLRLLRIARLFRYLSRWEEHFIQFNSSTIRMVKLCAVLLIFSHWNGCIQFLVAVLNRESIDGVMVFTEDSWVTRAHIDLIQPMEQWRCATVARQNLSYTNGPPSHSRS